MTMMIAATTYVSLTQRLTVTLCTAFDPDCTLQGHKQGHKVQPFQYNPPADESPIVNFLSHFCDR